MHKNCTYVKSGINGSPGNLNVSISPKNGVFQFWGYGRCGCVILINRFWKEFFPTIWRIYKPEAKKIQNGSSIFYRTDSNLLNYQTFYKLHVIAFNLADFNVPFVLLPGTLDYG